MVTMNKYWLSIVPVCGKLDSSTPVQILPNLLPVVDGRIYLPDDGMAQNRLNSADEKLKPEREVFQHQSPVSNNNRYSLIKSST